MAKNTLLMYFRMFVLIIVQLYTVPVVLRALGVEDYGIYNVVGGFVTMFTFINGSLVSGCQRFIAYAIGVGDKDKTKEVFQASLFIFLSLSMILFFLLEIIGVWFLNYRMTIPENRIYAANWVLQLSIFSLVISILNTPFHSAVIAHEKMSVYAYASIFESIYKLFAALCLTLVLMDKLIIYAFLIFLSAVIILLFYVFYCKRHFVECKKNRLKYNPVFQKEIGSYAGWNIIGSLAITLRNHGLNVVMNLFFTPVMNAAHTIASHVSGVLGQFVNNVYMSTRPQMVKQYAAGNVAEMWNITFKSGKYAFFLMTFIMVPALIELPAFLKLWLHDVPDYTIIFSQLLIVSLGIENITNPIIGAFQAENKIKHYQSVSSVILLSVVLLSYMVLNFVQIPILPYIIYVLVTLFYIISVLVVARRKLQLNISLYFKKVIIKDIVVVLLSFAMTYMLVSQFEGNYIRIFITLSTSTLFIMCTIWVLGLDELEKNFVKQYIRTHLVVGH